MNDPADLLHRRLASLERMLEVAREIQDYEMEKALQGDISSIRLELYDLDPLGAFLTHFIPAEAR